MAAPTTACQQQQRRAPCRAWRWQRTAAGRAWQSAACPWSSGPPLRPRWRCGSSGERGWRAQSVAGTWRRRQGCRQALKWSITHQCQSQRRWAGPACRVCRSAAAGQCNVAVECTAWAEEEMRGARGDRGGGGGGERWVGAWGRPPPTLTLPQSSHRPVHCPRAGSRLRLPPAAPRAAAAAVLPGRPPAACQRASHAPQICRRAGRTAPRRPGPRPYSSAARESNGVKQAPQL